MLAEHAEERTPLRLGRFVFEGVRALGAHESSTTRLGTEKAVRFCKPRQE